MGERDLLQRRVVMAGERHAMGFRDLDDARAVDRRTFLPDTLPLQGDISEIGGRTARLAGVIDEIFLEIAELPLARRMVHQRDQLGLVGAQEDFEKLDDIGRRDLATQMREVLRAQQSSRLRAPHGLRERHDLLAQARARFIFVHADAERVEDRRDARRRDLRVIGEDRAARVPDDGGARHVMGLQMIGVQLDEAGQQINAGTPPTIV